MADLASQPDRLTHPSNFLRNTALPFLCDG